MVPIQNVNGKVQTSGPFVVLTDNAFTNFDPTWSPNSKFIAFSSTRNGNRDIYRMSTLGETDGANFMQLTTSTANDTNPAWSPDGKLIAFASERSGMNQIYVLKPVQQETANNPPVLVSDGTANDDAPAWRTPRRWLTAAVLPPETNPLGPQKTMQFTARVTGTPNTAVTWSVNNITGGSGTVGTISASGLFTAPTVAYSTDVTVTAASVMDATKFGGATVRLFNACDVNNDGLVNVVDVQRLVNQVLGAMPASSDINGDGAVNVVDVQLAVNAVLGEGCKR
jgi:Tol biopolymer transport system component